MIKSINRLKLSSQIEDTEPLYGPVAREQLGFLVLFHAIEYVASILFSVTLACGTHPIILHTSLALPALAISCMLSFNCYACTHTFNLYLPRIHLQRRSLGT